MELEISTIENEENEYLQTYQQLKNKINELQIQRDNILTKQINDLYIPKNNILEENTKNSENFEKLDILDVIRRKFYQMNKINSEREKYIYKIKKDISRIDKIIHQNQNQNQINQLKNEKNKIITILDQIQKTHLEKLKKQNEIKERIKIYGLLAISKIEINNQNINQITIEDILENLHENIIETNKQDNQDNQNNQDNQDEIQRLNKELIDAEMRLEIIEREKAKKLLHYDMRKKKVKKYYNGI